MPRTAPILITPKVQGTEPARAHRSRPPDPQDLLAGVDADR